MPESIITAISEPLLLQTAVLRSSRRIGWKAKAFFALLIGCAVGFSSVKMSSYARGEGGERVLNLAAYSPVGTARQFLVPKVAGHVMQPAKIFQLARTRKPLVEPARARYGIESLGPGKGMTGKVDETFQAWGDLATLGSGKAIEVETPEWLAYEQTDGVEYTPGVAYDPGQGGQPSSESSNPGVPGKGVIMNWLTAKGFGFIKPDDGGPDVYAHVTALVDGPDSVQKGDEVTYVKEFNTRRQKDQAVQIELVPGGKRGSDSPPAVRDVGKLVRWNSEKGYGFVKPKEGDDLFVHVSGLSGGEGSVKIGDEVSYTSSYDKKRDKTRAVNVRLATEEEKKAAEEEPAVPEEPEVAPEAAAKEAASAPSESEPEAAPAVA